jgi:choline dehydrogenase-like flavoprotein
MQLFENDKVVDGKKESVEGQIIFNDAAYAFQELRDVDARALFADDASPRFAAIQRGDKFKIILLTDRYAPNNLVTIRTSDDGWTKEIYGVYAFGGWIFELEQDSYADKIQFKFVLNHRHWIEGFDREVNSVGEHRFTDNSSQHPGIATVTFPPEAESDKRFIHSYENLRTHETFPQQKRFFGNRQTSKVYDVIVIGSGMGGGIVADAISDKGYSTLVLELGGLETPTHVGNVYADWDEIVSEHQVGHYDRREGSNFLFGAQMALGGRSVYWSGIILRMQEWEMKQWPQSVQDFLIKKGANGKDGYQLAEELMRMHKTLGTFQDEVIGHLKSKLPDLKIQDLPRSSHQPNLNDQNTIDSVLFSSTGIFSTADLLSDSKAFPGAPGFHELTVNLNHLVTEIRADPSDPMRVKEVVCQDLLGNQERVYQGRAIVLAAGSIESPKIFLQSNLKNASGKAGVGLTDHPYLFSSNYLIPKGSPFWGGRNHAKILLSAGDASEGHYPFYVELLINPWYWHVRRADDDLWESLPDEQTRTEVAMKFGFAQSLVDSNWVRSEGANKKASIKVNNLSLDGKFIEQARLFRNRILSALEIPHDPNQGMGVAPHGGTVNHAGGTLRMNNDPNLGVVDGNLKCHGYENLFVADTSVFPYIPTANPSLTLGALGIRLAEHLDERFKNGTLSR